MTDWIDGKRANDICAGDGGLYGSLVSLFLETYEEMRESIEAALENRSPASIQDAVHKLKGSLRNLAAPKAVEALQKAEDAARGGDTQKAADLWRASQDTLTSTIDELISGNWKNFF